jgi:hypothetical protein
MISPLFKNICKFFLFSKDRQKQTQKGSKFGFFSKRVASAIGGSASGGKE